MSTYARMRKMRIRSFKPYHDISEKIGNNQVFFIHDIPKKIEYGFECDFWVMDGKDCYLLRIEKNKENAVYFIRSNNREPLYCIMKIDILNIDIIQQLTLLKRLGIPYKFKGRKKIKL